MSQCLLQHILIYYSMLWTVSCSSVPIVGNVYMPDYWHTHTTRVIENVDALHISGSSIRWLHVCMPQLRNQWSTRKMIVEKKHMRVAGSPHMQDVHLMKDNLGSALAEFVCDRTCGLHSWRFPITRCHEVNNDCGRYIAPWCQWASPSTRSHPGVAHIR